MTGEEDALASAERIFQAYVASGGAEARELPLAADQYRHTLTMLPGEHQLRLPVAANLMACLRGLFLASGEATHLDEAIEVAQREIHRAGPSARPPLAFHTSLAGVHNARFQHNEEQADLDAALAHLRAALDLAYDTEPDRLFALRSNLAFTLRLRYDIVRNRADLAEAIDLVRSAHRDAPDPIRFKIAYMLSSIVGLRYRDFGDSADLDEALRLATDVVARTEESHPEYSGYLAHLALLEVDRHRRTGDPQARERAAAHYERLVGLLDAAPAIRPVVMANWSVILETADGAHLPWRSGPVPPPPAGALALVTRMLPELESAAAEARDNAHRPVAMAALARAHLAVHTIRGSGENLRAAIDSAEEAVAGTPPEHPDHAGHALVAAATRFARWAGQGDRTDLERADALLTTASDHPAAAPTVRIQAAHALAATRMSARDATGAGQAAQLAVGLLPVVAWPGIERADQEFRLAQVADVSCDATAAALAAGHRDAAVESNEAGRAVLWAHLLNRRTDLAAVSAVAPALASEMARIRRDLLT